MEPIFIQLAVILFTAFVVSYVVRAFKQPLIIGYIIAGMIISPYIISFGASKEIIDIFSKFGIAFLLFMVGLHMNPKVIREIGAASLIIGTAQMLLTFALGFFVSVLLGFNNMASSFIGIALAFSSTIIIMKLLSDRKQIDSLYGKISIGILILQDLVAIIFLMIVSSASNLNTFSSIAVRSLFGGGGLIVVLFLIGFFIFPKVLHKMAESQELLFLFSITWAFVVAALFSYLGFSIEIGALVAGIVLSISPYSLEISSKIRPLRDFFLIIFFIILGFNLPVSTINTTIIVHALIFSLIALIFKPLILMTFSALNGYTKRTNFLVGTTLGQISEFSLIILAVGVSKSLIPVEILSTLTLTGIITITISTYMIIYSNKIYSKTYNFVSMFEKKRVNEKIAILKKYDAILFGYNRIGFNILRELKKIKKNYLVADFNPDTIEALSKFGIPSVYGDGYDTDFLDELSLDKIKLAISTIPDFETNIIIVERIRKVNSKAIVIARASEVKEAFALYRKGASYVLTPYYIGGEHVAKMIEDYKLNNEEYRKEKRNHIKFLEEIAGRNKRHILKK
ncbi:sodium:proton exchanger [Candidatus Pacearchaeota archaeon CG10_big_fil_rev_8_21_14_0_10_34_12]|nr:MAG: sodium:proton exchanger [Candidatus Pacearchaeota archaeon CG10_big_fil_rev_8_21_14_0_10_34_12]